MTPADRYAVGKIVSPRGLKGFVKVLPTTHRPDRFRKLKEVWIGSSPDTAQPASVEEVVMKGNGIFVKLSGFDSRTAVDAVLGQFLFVGEDEVVPPPKGSYFVHDIIGCAVEDSLGNSLGTVTDVLKKPGQDLWTVLTPDGRTVFVPAAKEFLEKVKVDERRIVLKKFPDV